MLFLILESILGDATMCCSRMHVAVKNDVDLSGLKKIYPETSRRLRGDFGRSLAEVDGFTIDEELTNALIPLSGFVNTTTGNFSSLSDSPVFFDALEVQKHILPTLKLDKNADLYARLAANQMTNLRAVCERPVCANVAGQNELIHSEGGLEDFLSQQQNSNISALGIETARVLARCNKLSVVGGKLVKEVSNANSIDKSNSADIQGEIQKLSPVDLGDGVLVDKTTDHWTKYLDNKENVRNLYDLKKKRTVENNDGSLYAKLFDADDEKRLNGYYNDFHLGYCSRKTAPAGLRELMVVAFALVGLGGLWTLLFLVLKSCGCDVGDSCLQPKCCISTKCCNCCGKTNKVHIGPGESAAARMPEPVAVNPTTQVAH